MRFRKRPRPVNVKMANRAKKVASPDLVEYLNVTLLSMGAMYDAWRYHNAPAGEFTMHLEAANAIWAELASRGLTPD